MIVLLELIGEFEVPLLARAEVSPQQVDVTSFRARTSRHATKNEQRIVGVRVIHDGSLVFEPTPHTIGSLGRVGERKRDSGREALGVDILRRSPQCTGH
jgi:hypothetical protein